MARTKAKDPKTLRLACDASEPDHSREEINSKLIASPALQAACSLEQLAGGTTGQTDLTRSMELATERARRVSGNDLSELEEMLSSQATTLDVVFHTLLRRSAQNMGEHMEAVETYMKLALRAQAQCRSTIEALAEIKNPKAVFVSAQTNISNGHQQVNNSSRTAENEKSPNEQSGNAGHELPENRTAPAVTSRTNPPLETLETLDRAKIGRR